MAGERTPVSITPEAVVTTRIGGHGMYLKREHVITPESITTPTPRQVADMIEKFKHAWEASPVYYPVYEPLGNSGISRRIDVEDTSKSDMLESTLRMLGQGEIVNLIKNPPDPVGDFLAEKRGREIYRRKNPFPKRAARRVLSTVKEVLQRG